MATKSIYKNVTISSETSGRSLADALEKSQAEAKRMTAAKEPNRVAKSDIKGFLGRVAK